MATALISGMHTNKILMRGRCQSITINNCKMLALTEDFTAPLKRRITIVKPRIARRQRKVGVKIQQLKPWLPHDYKNCKNMLPMFVNVHGPPLRIPFWWPLPFLLISPCMSPPLAKKQYVSVCNSSSAIMYYPFPLHACGWIGPSCSVGIWNRHHVFKWIRD